MLFRSAIPRERLRAHTSHCETLVCYDVLLLVRKVLVRKVLQHLVLGRVGEQNPRHIHCALWIWCTAAEIGPSPVVRRGDAGPPLAWPRQRPLQRSGPATRNSGRRCLANIAASCNEDGKQTIVESSSRYDENVSKGSIRTNHLRPRARHAHATWVDPSLKASSGYQSLSGDELVVPQKYHIRWPREIESVGVVRELEQLLHQRSKPDGSGKVVVTLQRAAKARG